MDFSVVQGKDVGDVRLFTLSSCAWCGKIKELLSRLGVAYRYVDTDLLEQKEQDEIVGFLDSITEEWGFPALLIHDKYLLCGYKEKATLKLLGMADADPWKEEESKGTVEDEGVSAAYDRLSRMCEKKGWFLNPDRAFTGQLVKSLLVNQERYGYWACPCRLASGKREQDRDIVCPCEYRGPDVAEYGACYCALFVSEEVARGEAKAKSVPERRKK